jgi:hypothetical protein
MAKDKTPLSSLSALPESCTSLSVNLVAFGCFLIAAMVVRRWGSLSTVDAALVMLLALAIPLVLLELLGRRIYRRHAAAIDFRRQADIDWQRVAFKLVGYYLTLGIIALLYWLVPVYRADFYRPFWELLEVMLPWFLLGAIPYFIWLDRYMINPRDGYWQCGAMLLKPWREVDHARLGQYALAWLVKAFFLPLMFGLFCSGVEYFRNADMVRVFTEPDYGYGVLWEFFYVIDLVFVIVGYTLTVRLLDTHIRSTEPTLSGWVVALLCYEPFWGLTYGSYVAYNLDGFSWGHWLTDSPLFYAIWGSSILLITAMYASTSVAFGMRFSNLTHRGIITNGLYRYCKHPAYVAKNLSWWLISIPFITDSGMADALRDSLLLLMVNLIYFARARTEERHLSWDPVYVQYATVMNRRSVFSGLARWLPFLQYRPPVTTVMSKPLVNEYIRP